jgi:hypothetical protein
MARSVLLAWDPHVRAVIAARAAAAERAKLLLAVRHTCACQPCKDAVAALTGDTEMTT